MPKITRDTRVLRLPKKPRAPACRCCRERDPPSAADRGSSDHQNHGSRGSPVCPAMSPLEPLRGEDSNARVSSVYSRGKPGSSVPDELQCQRNERRQRHNVLATPALRQHHLGSSRREFSEQPPLEHFTMTTSKPSIPNVSSC